MLAMLPGGLLELGAAAFGARLGGLTGLSIGWVAATYIESIFMFRTVYKAVWGIEISTLPTGQDYWGAESIWLVNTSPLPAIRQSYMGAEAIWLMDTSLLPAVSLPALRLPDFQQTSRETDMHRKSFRDFETNWRSGSARRRLRPPRLRPYTSYERRQ